MREGDSRIKKKFKSSRCSYRFRNPIRLYGFLDGQLFRHHFWVFFTPSTFKLVLENNLIVNIGHVFFKSSLQENTST